MLNTEKQYITSLLYFEDKQDIQREMLEGIKTDFFENERIRKAIAVCFKGLRDRAVINIDFIERNGIKFEMSDLDDSLIVINEKMAMQTKNYLIREYQERCIHELKKTSSNNPGDIDSIVEKLRSIQNLNLCTNSKSLKTLYEEQKEAFFVKNNSNLLFGISALDSDVKIRDGDMAIIGARTGNGKSALALQFAVNMASNGAKILYFNLEMSERQILERIIAYKKEISLSRLSYAESFYNDEERAKFEAFSDIGQLLELFKVCSGSYDISKITLEARRNNPNVIFIDYLQLVKPSGSYKGNRVAEVSEVSHKLKALAMDLKIPIIALSQLNRESERKGKPTVSDLRECGDIENDASIVLLLWNDDSNDEIKHIEIAKNRQGKKGSYNLYFKGKYMTFSEWKTPSEEDQEIIPFKADGG